MRSESALVPFWAGRAGVAGLVAGALWFGPGLVAPPLAAANSPTASTAFSMTRGAADDECVGEKCRGKYARDVGCDDDARTVKSTDVLIQRRPIERVEPRVGAGGKVSGDATGGAAGGAAGAAGGAAGGRATGSAEGNVEISVGVERGIERSFVGVLEVRHSPRCGTAWARILTESSSPISRVSITKAGAGAVSRNIRPGTLDRRSATPVGNYYSPMVYVGETGRVIAEVRGGAGGPGLANDRPPVSKWVVPADQ